jgi:uncharacterized membrane protein YkvA (DUF1232 family)
LLKAKLIELRYANPTQKGVRSMRLFRLWRLMNRDARLLLLALRRADRQWWLLPAVLLLLVFALDPANFALPALGLVDDLVLLPLLLHLLVKFSGADRLAISKP